ncbi:MAG TPA: hypothetical protein VF529_12520 [Solirubrobacteraceae bacterium]|jgi:hypothetical protein
MLARGLISSLAAFAALAAPAFGATVRIQDGDLVYTAAPGEFNELNITLQGGRFTIQDGTTGFPSTMPVTAEPPCEPYDNEQSSGMTDATCPPDAERVLVDVGDGSDYVGLGAMGTWSYPTVVALGEGADRLWGGAEADEIDGGDGADTLTPNAGRDVVRAGPGDDTIDAVDGFPDEIVCGDGYDLVDADDVDTVDGCENVRSGSPRQPPVAPPPPQPPAPPVEPPVVEPAAGAAPPRVVDVITQWPTVTRLMRLGILARVLCAGECYVASQLHLRTAHGTRIVGEGRARRSDAGLAEVRTRLLPGRRPWRRARRPQLVLRLEVTAGERTTTFSRRIWLSASR